MSISSSSDETQRLWVCWRHPPGERAVSVVGTLDHRDGLYRFGYAQGCQTVPGFRPLFGFGDYDTRYASRDLFALFAQRLMNPRRRDYRTYLDTIGLDESAGPLEILGRSQGRRAGDSIHLMTEPSFDEHGRTEATFFVHEPMGVSGGPVEHLRAGQEVRLYDGWLSKDFATAMAIAILPGMQLIGWVPPPLVPYVKHLGDGITSFTVVRINDADAPPYMRTLVRLKGIAPAGSGHSIDGHEGIDRCTPTSAT